MSSWKTCRGCGIPILECRCDGHGLPTYSDPPKTADSMSATFGLFDGQKWVTASNLDEAESLARKLADSTGILKVVYKMTEVSRFNPRRS
jgi:hypothetical protein